jgi:hypothetical protein
VQAARAKHAHHLRTKLRHLGAIEKRERPSDWEPDLLDDFASLGDAPKDYIIGRRDGQ